MSRTLDYAEPLASEPWKAAYARALLAGEQGRLDDATAELAEALRLVPTDLPASDRAHLLYLFGVVHLVNGRAAQAVMNFTNAEAIPGALAREDHLWLLCRLARAKCELGAMASAAEVLGRLTAAAGDTAEPVLRFEILQLRAILATWNSTDLVTAESALREAISLADTTPLDPGLRARARTDLAAFLLVMQRAACEITPLCWQALGFLEEDGEPDDPEVARVHVLLASAALADGRPDDARRHAEWGLSIAECVLPTWNTTFVEAVTTLAQALDALGLEEAARRQRARLGSRREYHGYYEPRNPGETAVIHRLYQAMDELCPDSVVDAEEVRAFAASAWNDPDLREPIRAWALLASSLQLQKAALGGEAVSLADEGLALLRTQLAPDDPEFNQAAIITAYIAKLNGLEEKVQPLMRTAFVPTSADERPARAPAELARSWQRLQNAAHAALAGGRAKVASETFKRALEVAGELGPEGDQRRLEALRGLAHALAQQDRWDEVLPLLDEVVTDDEAVTLDDTGLMLHFAVATRGYAAPRLRLDWARRAAAARGRLLPTDHVDVIEALVVYAHAADDAGEPSEARTALAGAFPLLAATLPVDADVRLDAERLQYRYWIEDGAAHLAQELRTRTLRDTGVDLVDDLGDTVGGDT